MSDLEEGKERKLDLFTFQALIFLELDQTYKKIILFFVPFYSLAYKEVLCIYEQGVFSDLFFSCLHDFAVFSRVAHHDFLVMNL